MVSEEVLRIWNEKGLIPGPTQTDGEFLEKVRSMGSSTQEGIDFEITERLFGVAPDWLTVQWSRKGLSLWEGGATWCERKEEGFWAPLVQIRDDFGSSWWHRGYSVDEIVAHEVVHAVRSDFKEGAFEEILAYQTSKKRWRRWLGPLLQHPGEAKVFLAVLLGSLIVQWLGIFVDLPSWCALFLFLPWGVLVLGLARLMRNQVVFKRCLQRVAGAIKDPRKALEVAVRLTDAEIRLFARCLPDEIQAYTLHAKGIRWKMIALAYFS